MLINDSTRQRVDWSGPNNIGEKQSYFQGFMTSTNDQFQELSQNFMYGPMMHGYPMYPYAYHPYPMPPFDYYYQRGYNYPPPMSYEQHMMRRMPHQPYEQMQHPMPMSEQKFLQLQRHQDYQNFQTHQRLQDCFQA